MAVRPYISAKYVLTVMELSEAVDLEQSFEWRATLRCLKRDPEFQRLYWSYDLNKKTTLISLTVLNDGDSQDRIASTEHAWSFLQPLCTQPLQSRLLPFAYGFICYSDSEYVHELFVLDSISDATSSKLKDSVENLKMETYHGVTVYGHTHVADIIYGSGPEVATMSPSTFSMLFTWQSMAKRLAFQDPEKENDGSLLYWDDHIRRELEVLETTGVHIQVFLLKLQRWPPDSHRRRRRLPCVIL